MMRGLSAILIAVLLMSGAFGQPTTNRPDIYDLDVSWFFTTNVPGIVQQGHHYTTNRPKILPLTTRDNTARVRLLWERGQADSDLVGYIVYWGPESGNYTNSTFVGNVTSATIEGLERGSFYYFAATATNRFGLESDFSNEASTATPQ